MEDKFDEILGNKIRELTESSDASYNPEHWELLLAKKNKNKNRAFAFWKYAAIILLGLLAGGLGKYFYSNALSNKNGSQEIIFDTLNDSVRIDSLKKNVDIKITLIDNDSLSNANATIVISDSTAINKFNKFRPKKQHFINETPIIRVAENEVEKETIIDGKRIENGFVIKDKIKANNDLIAEKNVNTVKDSTFQERYLALKKKEEKRDSLRLDETLLAQLNDDIIEVESKRKGIKLGIGLSPILDYYQDSESSNVGFSGGVTIEISLSKRFNINTGVYYADQKLDINNPTIYLSDAVSAKGSDQIISKEAVIKGVEIPVNIKYNFNINNRNVFVSVGILSTQYLKENIESEYLVNSRTESNIQDSFGNNIVQYGLVQLSEKTIIGNDSNGFNFANALNFSLGIELPINDNKQSIIIEPYFKYSLKTVTNQNINLNSAGVHLRYNFNLRKNN